MVADEADEEESEPDHEWECTEQQSGTGAMSKRARMDERTIMVQDDPVSPHAYMEAIAWFIRETGRAPSTYNMLTVRPIPKTKTEKLMGMGPGEMEQVQKDPSKFREVILTHWPERKFHGAVLLDAVFEFIMANKLHFDIQWGYLPIDASRLNHQKLHTCREFAQATRTSIVIIYYDAESCFTLIQKAQRARAYEFASIPERTANELHALHEAQQARMVQGGRVFGPVDFKGDIMGSSESCIDLNLITCELGKALRDSGCGFQLPADSRGFAPNVPAVIQADDIKVIAGGQHKGVDQVIEEASVLNQIVVDWACEYGQVLSVSKTVYVADLRDRDGNEVERELEFYIPPSSFGTNAMMIGAWAALTMLSAL